VYRLFIDSDVLLDVLARREAFYPDSAGILSLAEMKKIRAYTSPIVIANLFYILRKIKSKRIALESIRKLRLFIGVLPVTESHIDKALASKFKDFEDAIQYFVSSDNGIEYIITRNKQDYKQSRILVFTPAEFLKLYHLQFGAA